MAGARLSTWDRELIPINGNPNPAFLLTSVIFILPAEGLADMVEAIFMFLIYYQTEDGSSLKTWGPKLILPAMNQALLSMPIIKLFILLLMAYPVMEKKISM